MIDNPTGTIVVPYPFVKGDHTVFDEEGVGTEYTWIPGHKEGYTQYGQDLRYADGMGEMILTVVRVCELPKPYHPRVFYTRQWRDPNGKVFGKRGLRVAGITSFRRMASGYAYPVEVDHDHD